MDKNNKNPRKFMCCKWHYKAAVAVAVADSQILAVRHSKARAPRLTLAV